MPAPNIATLYDFESAYEDALANYFSNVNIGGLVFAQVLTPRTNLATAANLVTPRLQIKVQQTGLGATGTGWQEETVTVGTTTTNYYAYYQLTATLGVVTSRSNSSQKHGLYRGATRQGMLEITAVANNTTVPYLQTVFVTPQTSLQAIDAENDEIQTDLGYAIETFIPPSSWPNTQVD